MTDAFSATILNYINDDDILNMGGFFFFNFHYLLTL